MGIPCIWYLVYIYYVWIKIFIPIAPVATTISTENLCFCLVAVWATTNRFGYFPFTDLHENSHDAMYM